MFPTGLDRFVRTCSARESGSKCMTTNNSGTTEGKIISLLTDEDITDLATDETTKKPPGKKRRQREWTDDEDKIIHALVNAGSRRWTEIGRLLGRTADEVRHYWKRKQAKQAKQAKTEETEAKTAMVTDEELFTQTIERECKFEDAFKKFWNLKDTSECTSFKELFEDHIAWCEKTIGPGATMFGLASSDYPVCREESNFDDCEELLNEIFNATTYQIQ